MEEIIITFSGSYNLTIHGEIIQTFKTTRNNGWEIRLFNNECDETISLPSSSFKDKNCIIAIRTNNAESHPTFWSIDTVESEKDTFIVTIYPNAGDLLKRLNNKS